MQIYSELTTPVNASTSCSQRAVCTDSHGADLQSLHLLCGCLPADDDDASSSLGLGVQLSGAQVAGVLVLLLCALALLLFLLKKCCSASLFLRCEMCCALLCFAVLCCAVLCCDVMCCVVLCCELGITGWRTRTRRSWPTS
jgi:hypothetical protein